MFGAKENLWLYLESEFVVFVLDDVFNKVKKKESLDQPLCPTLLG